MDRNSPELEAVLCEARSITVDFSSSDLIKTDTRHLPARRGKTQGSRLRLSTRSDLWIMIAGTSRDGPSVATRRKPSQRSRARNSRATPQFPEHRLIRPPVETVVAPTLTPSSLPWRMVIGQPPEGVSDRNHRASYQDYRMDLNGLSAITGAPRLMMAHLNETFANLFPRINALMQSCCNAWGRSGDLVGGELQSY